MSKTIRKKISSRKDIASSMVSIPVTLKESSAGWWGALVGRFPEIMFVLYSSSAQGRAN